MTIFDVLNKRFKYEGIVSYRKTYDLPNYNSSIDDIRYFINNGYKNNRFRKNFNQAMSLAIEINNYYENRFMESLDIQLER